MRIRIRLLALLLLAFALRICPALSAELSVEGIPNFHQVDPRLFRGAQPLDVAWPKLSALGVSTVIDLRRVTEHSTAEESLAVEAAGMRYVSFPMNGVETPTTARMASALALVGESDTVFVHCKAGADRTGTVVALYRITREHWTNQRALDEAESCGMHWYAGGMKHFILSYRAPDRTPVVQGPAFDSTDGQ